MQFDHIFPKGEFAVTEKIDDYTLRAAGMDFNLTDCLLDGVEGDKSFLMFCLLSYHQLQRLQLMTH